MIDKRDYGSTAASDERGTCVAQGWGHQGGAGIFPPGSRPCHSNSAREGCREVLAAARAAELEAHAESPNCLHKTRSEAEGMNRENKWFGEYRCQVRLGPGGRQHGEGAVNQPHRWVNVVLPKKRKEHVGEHKQRILNGAAGVVPVVAPQTTKPHRQQSQPHAPKTAASRHALCHTLPRPLSPEPLLGVRTQVAKFALQALECKHCSPYRSPPSSCLPRCPLPS